MSHRYQIKLTATVAQCGTGDCTRQAVYDCLDVTTTEAGEVTHVHTTYACRRHGQAWATGHALEAPDMSWWTAQQDDPA